MSPSRSKPELLAPAGTRDSFLAALAAGADAVYLGLGTLNARRNADNFTIQTLAAACDMAHLAGKKVFLTANTLVLDSEMDEALELVANAWECGIDAAIVADLGLASCLSRDLPALELHASTQMNVQNTDAIQELARRGFSRVTLARELSLKQIEQLSHAGLELEVFAHGALCVCYSGQCLMSSLIGRRSANRGLCAQPCRLAYSLEDGSGSLAEAAGKHLLSPRDLSTISLLPKLIEAGVSSFKIEGRMKAPDYVANVIGAYRSALDRAFEDPSSYMPSDEELSALDESFSRGFTTSYLDGKWDEELMNHKRPNNRGVLIGRVSSLSDGLVTLTLTKELNEGDMLEFWTARGNYRMEVDERAARASSELSLSMPVAHPVSPGDRVFRVRNAKMREEASSLTDGFAGPVHPVDFTVDARIGHPLTITVSDGSGKEARVCGEVVEAARTKAISEDDIREHIGRLGGTPYEVRNWDIRLDEGVGMGFSALHGLRREALLALESEILSPWRSREPYAGTRVSMVSGESGSAASGGTGTLSRGDLDIAFLAPDAASARLWKRAGVSRVYVPYEVFDSQPDSFDADGVSIVLPTAVCDEELSSVLESLPSRCDVVADSLASIVAASTAGHRVEAGIHLGLLNSASAETIISSGADRIWISPELSIDQVGTLRIPDGIGASLTVVGHQELMVMRHCVLMAQGPCSRHCDSCTRRRSDVVLKDEKGYDFPVRTDLSGRSHLYNGVCLDVISTVPDLIASGVDRFIIDGTCMSHSDIELSLGRLQRVLGGAKPTERPQGTTTGHLFRGVL